MDDQPAPGVDFSDWFLKWLHLVGECEQARGCMIDDDMEVAVMLKRPPKELKDHLVLESPQSVNVENKFPVMRELIQHWCRSRGVLFPQKPPMEIAAVSTTAEDSDATVSALGWYGSWHEKGHGKEKNSEKGKGKVKCGNANTNVRKHHDSTKTSQHTTRDPTLQQQDWRFSLVSPWRLDHTRGSRQDIHSTRVPGSPGRDTTTTHKKSTAHSNMAAERVLNVRPG